MLSALSSEQGQVSVSTEVFEAQTVVIGAGVIGLAIARALAKSGQEVIVLEGAGRFGEGISSRNSEVIHGGIYYPERSLKAELCVEGRQQLYHYCQTHKVDHRKCGKWIVAVNEAQGSRLQDIQMAADRNGVVLSLYEGRRIAPEIPEIRASSALWSPETGIIDSHGLMLSLLGELQDAGGELVLRSPVVAAESDCQRHLLHVGGDNPLILTAQNVINAAGLGAIPLANVWAGLPGDCRPQQWFARGVYFSYSGRCPFKSLIYPIPEPGGLGVHLTLDLAGQARFGPDVEWIDHEDYTVDSNRLATFVRGIRQWWPGLEQARLQPAYAGIRPKLSGPEGGFSDFRIDGPEDHGLPGLVNLFGIESPGLTSCLAIADRVKAMLV
ncbi:NAD(P)/FAD-dependent oxidoreductase [Marinobacter sp. F3R08]|uniref:NAD(P)/FAD-dependent oxidoreductase n=1 Tax=Marinobacter sp. F3R08 TaxID=2841559 RepID=UPI001C09495E|nr:NAD(P)/FAD-dependent oxidoreductase [Marinobacter sp. F3R08]MBU2954561.1 NAD(P)/FAD-dependent oxidoreductase [Marinobacter sp. F3R08]